MLVQTKKAAPAKMPPLAPGEFRFITNALTADTEAPKEGPLRFRAVASSTVTDLVGNTISLKALHEMRDDFRKGQPIFMDHDYTNVVDKAFGMTDSAEIVETAERDPRTGAPIYDLIVAGPVNEPNPKAVQLHQSAAGGYFKFGASIGAIVRKHTRDKETGGMLIDSISVKEASIVGIPKNQRSWVYKASAAAADLPDDEDLSDDEPEETEEQVIAASGEILQQWVVKPDTTVNDSSTTVTANGTTNPLGLGVVEAPLDSATTEAEDTASDDAPAAEPVEEPAATEVAAEDETTPGGQEAEAATPETAPTIEESADPAIEQQASIPVEDVAALVRHTAALVEEIGKLRVENERLQTEIKTIQASVTELATVEQDATEAIKKVMALPLRRQAVGHVEDFVARYPGFDPRVSAYIEKATKESTE